VRNTLVLRPYIYREYKNVGDMVDDLRFLDVGAVYSLLPVVSSFSMDNPYMLSKQGMFFVGFLRELNDFLNRAKLLRGQLKSGFSVCS
jgi:hypothetical protein